MYEICVNYDDSKVIVLEFDGVRTAFPHDANNPQFVEYQKWLDAGNVPHQVGPVPFQN